MHSPQKDRPKTWNNNRRGKPPKYEYKKLNEIVDSPQNAREIVNIYGVVIDCRPAKKSKGSDFYSTLRLVDPSYCKNEGLKIMLFHSDSEQLPEAQEFDIIRLHRVRIDSFMGQVSLISSRWWSWVLWPGKAVNDMESGVSGSDSYTLLETDKKHVKELRNWVKVHNFQGLHLDGIATDENIKLCQVDCGHFFNWIGQVVGIAIPKPDAAVLKVWDGTLPTHKIATSNAIDEETEFTMLSDLPDLDPYVVDVTIYDNHVKTLKKSDIKVGSYIRLCNMHASPKLTRSEQEAVGDKSQYISELYLHGGVIFDRGILPVDEDMDDTVEVIQKQKQVLEELQQKQKVDENSNKRTHSPISTPTNRKKQRLNIEVSPSDDGYQTPPQHLGDASKDTSPILQNSIVEKIATPSQDTLEMLLEMDNAAQPQVLPDSNLTNMSDSDDVSTQNSASSVLRCHQDSHTVVFGDSSPLNVTKIRDVINADVPVRTSKLFRIRAKIQRCSNIDQLVYHHCPATGINIPATNDGENLEIPDDLHEWLNEWRKMSGFDQNQSARDGDRESILNTSIESLEEEETNTQWPVPGLPENIKMSTFRDPNDKSDWQNMICKNHVIRKRKCGSEKFTILYDSQCEESLVNLAGNYNRVVRITSRNEMTSSSLPPVVYQGGIYYYCSPGCVSTVSVPPLMEESKSFRSSSPTQALMCPLLLHRFFLLIQFADDTDHLVATLSGKSAISFFNGVTPEKYLADPQCPSTLKEELSRLLGDSESLEAGEPPFVEVVIEKKSRRPLVENDPPVILYDVINTRLRQW
uniref:Protection of telomeres protein 1 n=1 Tax=Phallusia mammillata TaxID=59560 RepID=A0A6F9DIA6_9ASCI|nr:uncharacterized protein LOC100181958 [Phallusia mammillata]